MVAKAMGKKLKTKLSYDLTFISAFFSNFSLPAPLMLSQVFKNIY